MTHIYDALMDNLAALAVEAVHHPVMAVQSYWLALMAQQDSSGSCLTLDTLLWQSREATTLPIPPWAQPLASQALGRLLRDGIWLERLETLLEQLETLSNPQAYQFDPRHVPHLLNLKMCGG